MRKTKIGLYIRPGDRPGGRIRGFGAGGYECCQAEFFARFP